MIKNLIFWFFIIIVLIFCFKKIDVRNVDNYRMNYSDFLIEVNHNKICDAKIYGRKILVTRKDMTKYITYLPMHDDKLISLLLKKNVNIIGCLPKKQNILVSIFFSCLPTLILMCAWVFFIKQVQTSGETRTFLFGQSKAKILFNKDIKVTFIDVAGCEEAKEEVSELVEYLKEPTRFQKLGGKIPKGILMAGPPGTGKTLLAKAIAGEAKVPFFTISGSDFVEMFVGVGASRVRNMFENARKCAPCIIFIDEIDAVGRKRSLGSGGSGNDEREQTLNQILVEMDGFERNQGIILIAATNRPDVLDPALLRPGRFDRQVLVSLPDIRGREEILKIHMKKIPVSEDVIPIVLAQNTPGFSGADLANLVNESALLAARLNKNEVSMLEFEKSKDKIFLGSERTSMMLTKKQKECIAYHESGHVIVSKLVPDHNPVQKVSIIPRGNTLGTTFFYLEHELYNVHRQKLESELSALYGGRLAEEIIYGVDMVSTGSCNDIQKATNLARKMVTQWGFSEKLGPLLYIDRDNKEGFLRSPVEKNKNLSNETTRIIDEEIKLLIEKNYNRAKKILYNNIDILHAMKNALMKYETIDSLQVDDLMSRKLI